MSLTKAQKETLTLMRDKNLTISHWIHDTSYTLHGNGKGTIKHIRFDWILKLKPFFLKTYDTGYHTDRYTFNPATEISDAWLQAETARLAQAKVDEADAKQAEKERLNRLASDFFNDGNPGPYQVSFDGRWPFGGSILFNGDAIAQISAAHYSTSDKTFEDMIRRPENAPHFEAIKAMLRAANGATVKG